MDERRIQRTGDLLVEYADIETKIMPIIQKCLDNIKGNGKSVNGPQVCELIIGLCWGFTGSSSPSLLYWSLFPTLHPGFMLKKCKLSA